MTGLMYGNMLICTVRKIVTSKVALVKVIFLQEVASKSVPNSSLFILPVPALA